MKMTIFEITMTVLSVILIISVISVIHHQRVQIQQTNLLVKTLINFESLQYNDNARIFFELRHMNDHKKYPIDDTLRHVRSWEYDR